VHNTLVRVERRRVPRPCSAAYVTARRADGEIDRPAPTPFFFDEGRLFGVYYSNEPDRSGESPVLICPPVGHEYVRSYNAIRKLCERLSREGIAVLKFDYCGLGDSCGDGHDVGVDEWRQNIRAAAAELSQRTGRNRITVVGLRMGAALAAGLRVEGVAINNLVLWDPIVDGASHLAELQRLHRLCLTDTRRFRKKRPDGWTETELLGFRYSPATQKSIAKMGLLNRPYPYENCFLATSNRLPEYDELAKTLDRNTKGRFTQEVVPDVAEWDDHGRIEAALVCHRIIAAIAKKIGNGFV
jgi:uncharacterized protein